MLLVKTEMGQQAFKQRSPLFSARQRSAFILFDGIKSVDQVLAAAAGLGLTQTDVEYLVDSALLAPAPIPRAQAAPALPQVRAADAAPVPLQDRYAQAKLIATRLTAGLGLRGFMLNLSVESASGYAELLALLPKIQDAVGAKACRELEQVLTG